MNIFIILRNIKKERVEYYNNLYQYLYNKHYIKIKSIVIWNISSVGNSNSIVKYSNNRKGNLRNIRINYVKGRKRNIVIKIIIIREILQKKEKNKYYFLC